MGVIVAVDLIGAVLVSLVAGRVPMVLGDVAKVGVGALAGLLAASYARDGGQ